MTRRVIAQAVSGLGVIALAAMALFFFAAQQAPEADSWFLDFLSWVRGLPGLDGGGRAWRTVPNPQWGWLLYTAGTTLAIASTAHILFLFGAMPASALFSGGSRLASSWSAIACMLSLAALPWFAATMAACLDALNSKLGLSVALPSVPYGWHVFLDPSRSFVGYYLDLITLPVAILTLTLLPAMVRWMQLDATERDDVLHITGRPLPHFGFFVAAVLAVEVATPGRSGAWGMFFAPGSAQPERAATGLFLLAIGAVTVQALMTGAYVLVRRVGEGEGELRVHRIRHRPILASPAGAWSRLRLDRRFRVGLIIIAVVVLAAFYVRAWSTGGPNDIFNAAESAPPSASHWLGLDYLGRDRLTRLASALGGSMIVALAAAGIATVIGAALVAGADKLSPVPDIAGRIVAAVLAVPAAVWVAAPGAYSSGWATSRLALGLAIGLVGVTVAGRLLSTSRRSWRHAAAPLFGTAMAVAAGAFAIEFAASMLTKRMDAHTPTLGYVVQDVLREMANAEMLGLGDEHPMFALPLAWLLPAGLTLTMIAALSAMALSVFDPRSQQAARQPAAPRAGADTA